MYRLYIPSFPKKLAQVLVYDTKICKDIWSQMTPPPPLDFFRKFINFWEFGLPLALKGSFGIVIITPAILAQFSIVLNCIFVHFYTFHFNISAAMITAPIPDHLPGRLIKAAAATSDKDSSDKFRNRTKTRRTNSGRRISCRWCRVTMRIVSPDTQWARTPLMSPEHRDTSSARRQDTVETLLLCHKTSVRRQSQLPLHQHRQATGRPIIMEICTKNDLFGAIMSRGILETRLCASCN